MTEENGFTFSCPYCGQHLEADYDMVGMTFDCPACSQSLKVPEIVDRSHEGGIWGVSGELSRPSESSDDAEPTRPAPPVITVIRRRERFVDRCKKWLKTVGVGVAVLLLIVGVSILKSGDGEDEESAAFADEPLIDRLRRLKFDVKVNDKGCLIVSDTGVDEPIFIVEENGGSSSRVGCVTILKSFGPWFVRDSETIYTIKKRKGWETAFKDSKYTFLYLVRVGNGVSDRKLVATIRDVKKQSAPFEFDEKYQTRWAILFTIRLLKEYGFENVPNDKWCQDDKWCQSMWSSLESCPDDFQQAIKALFAAIPRQTEDMVSRGRNLGRLFGSMNENDPHRGALLGELFGAMVGAAQQEEANKKQMRLYHIKYNNLVDVARKYGADPQDMSDAPFGWKSK